MKIGLTQFVRRQLEPSYKGLVVTEQEIGELIHLAKTEGIFFEGYASFNQVVAISNELADGGYRFAHYKDFVVKKRDILQDDPSDCVRVQTGAGKARLRTSYEKRVPEELPVLLEWVEGVEPQSCNWIHLILYSKEQMQKEGDFICEDWGVVGINAGGTKEIAPMKPATALRNALGIEYGGSGQAICPKYYQKCVDFWQEHIMIRL